jgi:hypothetical protein
MSRASLTIAIVCAGTLSLSAMALAASPSPADIDACSQKAAAATRQSTDRPTRGEPNEANSGATHGADGVQPSASPGDTGGGHEAGEADRSAFAACLAEHGYYKGYYREHEGNR